MNHNIHELIYDYLQFNDKIKCTEYLNNTYLMKKAYEHKYNEYALIKISLINSFKGFRYCCSCKIIYNYYDMMLCKCPPSEYINTRSAHPELCKNCHDTNKHKYKCFS